MSVIRCSTLAILVTGLTDAFFFLTEWAHISTDRLQNCKAALRGVEAVEVAKRQQISNKCL